ncbi:MAG TPA: ATP-binding protein, partial [Jatrophihabitantaceae bacterium]
VVSLTTLVVLAFAIPIAFLIRTAVAQRAESETKDQAHDIALTLHNSTLTDAQIQAYVTAQVNDSGRPVSVVTPDGTQIGTTPADNGPQPNPPSGRGGPGRTGPGGEGVQDAELHDAPGGQVATAIASSGSGVYVVHVYLSDSDRYDGVGGWYLLLAGASVGLLLVAVVAGEVFTRRITRPLVRTAATAQQLSVGDTTARAPTDGPREVADVGKALNRLADRIDELLAEERETLADMSHRLRTPLTTLRLDAEALRDPAEAERVGAHVTQLERMLTAVIHAARRPQREGRLPSSDAVAVVRGRVEFWSALTDEQHRPRQVSLPDDPLPVRSSAEDLAAAVDALLENVVAHTADGTAFTVTLARTDTGARLEITDAGTGIPVASEVRGRSDRGSTGLGLDIARRCAEASGGSMTIGRAASGGASVILDLRAP